ncbi:MAG: ribosome-associated translation inhibitor RaiA [Bacteroidales bacterium]|jgi:ribosomal subunit interface protein|nr:ribosome-associated translation inhibitor RaiA [Bacteroidales bacterium]
MEVFMEIRVHSLKFDADQKLLDFIEKKVSKISRFDDTITDVEVVLSLLEEHENKNVKLQVHVPGGSQVIERNAKSFETAINDCVDAMKEKLTRNRERKTE